MKIIHFIILLISISIVASRISSLFPWTNWGNTVSQGLGTQSVGSKCSSSIESTRNYTSNYNCLVSTKNPDFNYLLNYYKSSCQNNNNCSSFVNELKRLANSCVSLGVRCNCEENKKLYQANGCTGYILQVLCTSQAQDRFT